MSELSVLMVDDQPNNLVALESILEDDRWCLVKANSGSEALKTVLQKSIDLVLLDVQMPDMDGFEVAELMRDNPKTQNIPIIFVTAISKDDRYVQKGYEKGAIDYLFKPLNPAVIRAKVSFFMGLAKQRRDLMEKLERSRAHRQAYEMEKKGNISE